MSATLYYSKLNINSHIYEVYEDLDKLTEILDKLLINLSEDVEYERDDLRKTIDGEEYPYNATYRFSSIDKLGSKFNYAIVGNIIKTANLFVNKVNERTDEISKKAVENSEIIKFYFDIYDEKVAFHTTNRFGRQEFNLAFKELLNMSMNEEEKEDYNFEVSLINRGLNIDEIKTELKGIGKLENLRIEIIPPNPDDDLLENMDSEAEGFLDSLEAGNITGSSVAFTSKAPEGLKIDSDVVTKEIDKIDEIHPQVSDEDATKNGYVKVEANNKEGRSYTTDDQKPIKDKIEDEEKNITTLFLEVCKEKLSSL